jgi:glycosyltransferase involved in cell wall biosynthesis
MASRAPDLLGCAILDGVTEPPRGLASQPGHAGSSDGFEYAFTVFTPTHDRAHTLHRVRDSLAAQTYRDFEWLVVDDGSTDGTAALVGAWQQDAAFPIRYVVQPHGGKLAAMTKAVDLARGALFVTADSDDTFSPRALERFKHHWDAIPVVERDRFSAVTALVGDQQGRIVGTPFPRNPTDSNALEIRYRYGVKGEKWGFQRTEVLRAHPAPRIEGYSGFIPESLIWNAIARRYKERYVNEVLRTYWRDQPGSLGSAARDPRAIAPGALLGYEALLSQDVGWARYAPQAFLVEAARYSRMAFHAGRPIRRQYRAIRSTLGRWLWLVTLPAGWTVYQLERLGLRRLASAARQNIRGS